MPGLQDLINKALGKTTTDGQGGSQGNQPPANNAPTIEQITEATVSATIAHLKETGQLVQNPTTTNTQPDPVGATAGTDFSKMDMSTPEGRKAFDEFVAANGKELVQFKAE